MQRLIERLKNWLKGEPVSAETKAKLGLIVEDIDHELEDLPEEGDSGRL